jgi:hypothetical protein
MTHSSTSPNVGRRALLRLVAFLLPAAGLPFAASAIAPNSVKRNHLRGATCELLPYKWPGDGDLPGFERPTCRVIDGPLQLDGVGGDWYAVQLTFGRAGVFMAHSNSLLSIEATR